jgi:hypothetical protein
MVRLSAHGCDAVSDIGYSERCEWTYIVVAVEPDDVTGALMVSVLAPDGCIYHDIEESHLESAENKESVC